MEIWKPIEWYEGLYEISNLARVKSLNYKNRRYESIMKLWILKWWYSYLTLCINKSRCVKYVHRLVALHFIPNPDNLPFVCHRVETFDENWALYNWVDNLFWGTHSDNMKDMHKKWRANNHLQLKNPLKGKFWKDHPRYKEPLPLPPNK
mgnify:CR=1 FL=1